MRAYCNHAPPLGWRNKRGSGFVPARSSAPAGAGDESMKRSNVALSLEHLSTKGRKTAILAAAALAAMSGAASAALNVYDPFNYSTGALQGNTNAGGGTANGNSWLQAGVANPPTGINVT